MVVHSVNVEKLIFIHPFFIYRLGLDDFQAIAIGTANVSTANLGTARVGTANVGST